MNIYLDINGVLLANNFAAANFADDFLQFVLNNWPDSTYWLTTYCWRGHNQAAKVLAPHLKPKTARLIRQVKPADWHDLKTDGINFSKPFLWFDDNLFPEERAILEHRDALPCHRLVNLSREPNQLLDEIAYLKTLVR